MATISSCTGVFAVLPAASSARQAPIPRVGDYYGEANGVTAGFQVYRARGKLKVRYVTIAGANGDLFGSLPSCKPPYATLEPASFGVRVKHGSFPFGPGVRGHFLTAKHARGTYTSGKCKVHWSARRVKRRAVNDGAWSGSSSIGPLTFTVRAGGREAKGQFSGSVVGPPPKNAHCGAPPFAVLIDPRRQIAGSFENQALGLHSGFVFTGRFTSPTTAHGTLQGTFDCASAAVSWSAHR